MPPSPGSVRERTCIGCRKKFSARELVCLMLTPSGVVPAPRDPSRRGRGAWIHPQAACVAAAAKTRAFARAFKGPVESPAVTDLLAQVTAAAAPGDPPPTLK